MNRSLSVCIRGCPAASNDDSLAPKLSSLSWSSKYSSWRLKSRGTQLLSYFCPRTSAHSNAQDYICLGNLSADRSIVGGTDHVILRKCACPSPDGTGVCRSTRHSIFQPASASQAPSRELLLDARYRVPLGVHPCAHGIHCRSCTGSAPLEHRWPGCVRRWSPGTINILFPANFSEGYT